jgi:solute carrier family 13 (sodium-dependent dicarboxylate transporter), member 2/3/5
MAAAPPWRGVAEAYARHRRPAWFALAALVGGAVLLAALPLGPAAAAVAAIAAAAMVLWVSEVLPLAATALLASLLLILAAGRAPREVFGAYFDPVVVLLLGGLALGRGLQEHGLDRALAGWLLARAGDRPGAVLFALMAAAATFSMWISNTATAAILLPVALGIAAANGLEPRRSNFGRACVLGVAYAAGIGGLGTPVGSTPNPLALRFLGDAGVRLGFGEWMLLMVPLVAAMVLAAWVLLMWLWPPELDAVARPPAEARFDRPRLGVMAVFFLTAGLWLTEAWHGLGSATVALGAVVLLFLLRLLDEEDVAHLGWPTLLLIGGSIALGDALQAVGLDQVFAAGLSAAVAGAPPYLAYLGVALACVGLTVVASNTAAAVVMIPLVLSSAPALGLEPRAGVLLAAAAVSFDFLVPVGTPPNAMAFATGAVRVRDMLRAGLPLTLLGAALAAAAAWLAW